MERREDRCLRSDAGRVDPDIVTPAIVRTICILIATNPLPVIFVPCELCLGGSMSSGIVLYETMFLTAADAYWMTAANACGFFLVRPEFTGIAAQD